MIERNDDELIEQFKKGDIAAFEILYLKYRNPVFSFLFHMLQDRASAEDVFQETFYRIIKNIKNYRPCERFSSFIYRIANNMAIDYLRKKRRSRESTLEESDGHVAVQRSGQMLPEREIEDEELKAALRKAITHLPIEQRQVLLLREFLDVPFKEISRLLGCPLNTALGRMHYALKNLKRSLDEYALNDEAALSRSPSEAGSVEGGMLYGV